MPSYIKEFTFLTIYGYIIDMEGGDAMKIRLEIADDLKEPEIIIRSTEMNEATAQLVSTLSDYLQKDASIPLYKEATVYYLPLKEILFFEIRG